MIHLLHSNRAIQKQIVEKYSSYGLLTGLFVRLRFLLAPILETAELVPHKGDIIDLGCGHGIFSFVLKAKFPTCRITGIDISEKRIQIAKSLNCDKSLKFVVGKVEDFNWSTINCVTIIDLLHHLPYTTQEQLLVKIYEKIGYGGFVVIKDLHNKPLWKYVFHYIQDTLSYREHLYFKSKRDMEFLLNEIGFKIKIVDLSDWRPHPHIVYICSK